jgi:hypothetical protein
VPDRITHAHIFKPVFQQALVKQFAGPASSSSLHAYNSGSFMSNSGGSAMCDHKPAAKNTTLPAASVQGASFAGQWLIVIAGHSYRAF